MKLTEIIQLKHQGYSNLDPKFRYIIYDHKKYIRESSTLFTITPQIKEIYRYRINKFMTEHLKITNFNIVWILFYINNIKPTDGLNGIDVLYIPDEDIIQSLYKKYLVINKKAS